MKIHDKEQQINRILCNKSYRTYFDDFSNEFKSVELETKLDRLAHLILKGYFETVIEEYLNRFEDIITYPKLTIMKRALTSTLKGYICLVRHETFNFQKYNMLNKEEDELEFILKSFKNDIIEIYIPKRGYNLMFTH